MTCLKCSLPSSSTIHFPNPLLCSSWDFYCTHHNTPPPPAQHCINILSPTHSSITTCGWAPGTLILLPKHTLKSTLFPQIPLPLSYSRFSPSLCPILPSQLPLVTSCLSKHKSNCILSLLNNPKILPIATGESSQFLVEYWVGQKVHYVFFLRWL